MWSGFCFDYALRRECGKRGCPFRHRRFSSTDALQLRTALDSRRAPKSPMLDGDDTPLPSPEPSPPSSPSASAEAKQGVDEPPTGLLQGVHGLMCAAFVHRGGRCRFGDRCQYLHVDTQADRWRADKLAAATKAQPRTTFKLECDCSAKQTSSCTAPSHQSNCPPQGSPPDGLLAAGSAGSAGAAGGQQATGQRTGPVTVPTKGQPIASQTVAVSDPVDCTTDSPPVDGLASRANQQGPEVPRLAIDRNWHTCEHTSLALGARCHRNVVGHTFNMNFTPESSPDNSPTNSSEWRPFWGWRGACPRYHYKAGDIVHISASDLIKMIDGEWRRIQDMPNEYKDCVCGKVVEPVDKDATRYKVEWVPTTAFW